MNYRHSFHAGNSADVVKHSLLIALVRALQQKEGALTLIDIHAGCGLYDLGGEEAQRTGEAAQGATRTPFAHPEGFIEAFANIYRGAATAIADAIEGRKAPKGGYDFPNIDDGVAGNDTVRGGGADIPPIPKRTSGDYAVLDWGDTVTQVRRVVTINPV